MDPGFDSFSQDSQDSPQIPGNPWLRHLKNKDKTRYNSIGTLVSSIHQRTNLPGLTPLHAEGIRSWLEKNEDRAGEFDDKQTSALVSLIQEYLIEQQQNDSQATTLSSLDGIADEPQQMLNTMPGFVDSESLAETVADGVAGYMNNSSDNEGSSTLPSF